MMPVVSLVTSYILTKLFIGMCPILRRDIYLDENGVLNVDHQLHIHKQSSVQSR